VAQRDVAAAGGAGSGAGGVAQQRIAALLGAYTPPAPRERSTELPPAEHTDRAAGAASVASFWAAVLTEIYLCNVCSCQEVLRRNGRG
jgi:hypothetical protein